jgi:hypothetical protein
MDLEVAWSPEAVEDLESIGGPAPRRWIKHDGTWNGCKSGCHPPLGSQSV